MQLSCPDSCIRMPLYGSLRRTSTTYKAAYDLAVQTGGETLPVTFKFGSDEQPEYYTFSRLDELKDFYTEAVRYIQKVLAEGWEKKDKFNLELYRIE